MPGCQEGHQRLKILANRLNDRLTRLTTSRRSGAGEPEEGDMPGAVAHGPGRSPVTDLEAAQVGVAPRRTDRPIPLAPRELGSAFFDKSLDGLFMVCSREAVLLQ